MTPVRSQFSAPDDAAFLNAVRALSAFDLSPDDRKTATQLLVTDLSSNHACEIDDGEIARVLRTIDCETVARRYFMPAAPEAVAS